MATDWQFALLAVCIDQPTGDQLAGAIGFDSGDSQTFLNGTTVTRDGVTGRFASIPLKQTGHDAVAEFLQPVGPYPTWNARGYSDAQVQALQTIFPSRLLGDASIRSTAMEWLASEGWTVDG
jgi:hypothetical protein